MSSKSSEKSVLLLNAVDCLEFPRCPTGPFTMLVPQDQGIGEFYEVQERRATDFEAPKLRKVWSGVAATNIFDTFILYPSRSLTSLLANLSFTVLFSFCLSRALILIESYKGRPQKNMNKKTNKFRPKKKAERTKSYEEKKSYIFVAHRNLCISFVVRHLFSMSYI